MSWGGGVSLRATSCLSQRFCKLCQARGNQGVRMTLQYPMPQPSPLWLGQPGREWSQGPDVASLRSHTCSVIPHHPFTQHAAAQF